MFSAGFGCWAQNVIEQGRAKRGHGDTWSVFLKDEISAQWLIYPKPGNLCSENDSELTAITLVMS
jgi:hypothetical protein